MLEMQTLKFLLKICKYLPRSIVVLLQGIIWIIFAKIFSPVLVSKFHFMFCCCFLFHFFEILTLFYTVFLNLPWILYGRSLGDELVQHSPVPSDKSRKARKRYCLFAPRKINNLLIHEESLFVTSSSSVHMRCWSIFSTICIAGPVLSVHNHTFLKYFFSLMNFGHTSIGLKQWAL